jgi:hypothetical protein
MVSGCGSVIAWTNAPSFDEGYIRRLLVPTGDGDLSAFCEIEACCSKTDAAIASCNESFLACEFHDSSCC